MPTIRTVAHANAAGPHALEIATQTAMPAMNAIVHPLYTCWLATLLVSRPAATGAVFTLLTHLLVKCNPFLFQTHLRKMQLRD